VLDLSFFSFFQARGFLDTRTLAGGDKAEANPYSDFGDITRDGKKGEGGSPMTARGSLDPIKDILILK
jgi:hypothetical protein